MDTNQQPAGSMPTRQNTTSTATGHRTCEHPIRLRGFYQLIQAQTGVVLASVGSPGAADGILLVSCKDRRSSCCPPCSRLYERDAFHLVAAGLRGGKNVPASIASHPAVMLTLTAPSFGAVHGHRDHRQLCKCGESHDTDDPALGTPIEPDRYRYVDQVVWNHYAPELWKRTMQAIRRGVAQTLGVPRSKLAQAAYVRFAKVAEFQRRGVVHYHAVIRIDGPSGANSPAPRQCTTEVLAETVDRAVGGATVALSAALLAEVASHTASHVRWGAQREVVALDSSTCTAAAGYIAKYATKATETAAGGQVIKPIDSLLGLSDLEIPDHVRALIKTAWTIGERTGAESFKRWAHQFGYGGHTLTKSHQYSVTFKALRAARTNWHLTKSGQGQVLVHSRLVYAGRGSTKSGELVLRADETHVGRWAKRGSRA